MKKYMYAYIIALLLTLGFSVRVSAQSTPSGQTTSSDRYPDNRPNYNYLGLLGLLGLYGLHKNRVKSGTVIDHRAV